MLVLLFVALWFIMPGDLFKVLSYVILFLCFVFLVFLALRLPRLGKKERANISVRMFFRFALVWLRQFSLPLGGLQCNCGTPWTVIFLSFFFSLQLI